MGLASRGCAPGGYAGLGAGAPELGLKRFWCCLGILVAFEQGALHFHFLPALSYVAEPVVCVWGWGGNV